MLFAIALMMTSIPSHAASIPECTSEVQWAKTVPMTDERIEGTLPPYDTLPTDIHGTYIGTLEGQYIGGRGNVTDLAILIEISKNGLTRFMMCTGRPKPSDRPAYWAFNRQSLYFSNDGQITLRASGYSIRPKHAQASLNSQRPALRLDWQVESPNEVKLILQQKRKLLGLINNGTEYYTNASFVLKRIP